MAGGVNGVMNFLSRYSEFCFQCKKFNGCCTKAGNHFNKKVHVLQTNIIFISFCSDSWRFAARPDPFPLPHGGHLLPFGLDRGCHELRLLLYTSTCLGSQFHNFVIFSTKNYFQDKSKSEKSSLQLRAKMLAPKPHFFETAEASTGTFNPNF